MYLSFYGLVEKPFSITPDPRYLFLSGRHAEALAHLVYGIDEAGGFIQLTGEVGTGKTTIIRSLLARQPDKAEIALILNPRMAAAEFMLTLCEELGILVPDSAETSVKDLIDILNRYLLRAHSEGRRVVLVVDEAQTLAPELLEQVRLLTNLETETQKLLQIILIGQPELRELLARNDLRQLAQRVTGRYHLDPLSRDETSSYIKHRLRIAGATNDIFTPSALHELYRVSGGVPRLLNIIADRALLGGFSSDRHLVGPDLVRRAAAEVYGRRVLPAWLPWAIALPSLALVAAAVVLAWPRGESGAVAPGTPAATTANPAAAAGAVPAATAAPSAAPATTPATAATVSAKVDLPGALLAPQARTSTDDAWWRLLQLWQARYVSSGEDACTQALRQGLECLAQRGSMATLRGYNRPAILTLRSGSQTHAVVLTRLDDSSAQLLLGQGTLTVPLAALQALWSGDFVLLWKPGSLDTRPLSLGMKGEPVRQLRARLASWQGQPVDKGGSAYYDESLQTRMRQFQQRNGLPVDGIAGLQTQAMLDAALPQPGTPVLTPLPGER